MKRRLGATLFLLTAPAFAEMEVHTATITLVHGARLHCSTIAHPAGSTTRCRAIDPSTPPSGARWPRIEIETTPERDAAWDLTYRYIRKARRGKRWTRITSGKLGTLLITEDHVALGSHRVGRSADEAVEAAIWQLVCRVVGLPPDP